MCYLDDADDVDEAALASFFDDAEASESPALQPLLRWRQRLAAGELLHVLSWTRPPPCALIAVVDALLRTRRVRVRARRRLSKETYSDLVRSGRLAGYPTLRSELGAVVRRDIVVCDDAVSSMDLSVFYEVIVPMLATTHVHDIARPRFCDKVDFEFTSL